MCEEVGSWEGGHSQTHCQVQELLKVCIASKRLPFKVTDHTGSRKSSNRPTRSPFPLFWLKLRSEDTAIDKTQWSIRMILKLIQFSWPKPVKSAAKKCKWQTWRQRVSPKWVLMRGLLAVYSPLLWLYFLNRKTYLVFYLDKTVCFRTLWTQISDLVWGYTKTCAKIIWVFPCTVIPL